METKAEIWLQQDFKLILKEKLGIFKPGPYIFICFGVIHTYSFGPVDRVSWQPRHICKGCTVIDDVIVFRPFVSFKETSRFEISREVSRCRKTMTKEFGVYQEELPARICFQSCGWIFNSFWQSATGTTHIWLDFRDFSVSETYKTDLVV